MTNPVDVRAAIEIAASNTSFSPGVTNSLTKEQIKQGDYQFGLVTILGLGIAIEQPKGSYRRGKSDGKPFATPLGAHYGFVIGTLGADGMPVDVFIGAEPDSRTVFVINQVNQHGDFDEHKCMLGFESEQAATKAYMDSFEPGWDGLGSIYPVDISTFKRWLRGEFRSLSEPFDPADTKGMKMQKIAWDSAANPVNESIESLLYSMRVHDKADGLLFDAATMADAIHGAESMGSFDSLVSSYSGLQNKMKALMKVMNATKGNLQVDSVEVSEPFRSGGTTNVVALMNLTDGQTFSIYFHNPDVTPKKIEPAAVVTSWRWIMNRKDVSVWVAPENGEDLNVREVARRMMRLANANSAKFQASQAKAAKAAEEIEQLEKQIPELESRLAYLEQQFALHEQAIVEATDRVKGEAVVDLESNERIYPVSAEVNEARTYRFPDGSIQSRANDEVKALTISEPPKAVLASERLGAALANTSPEVEGAGSWIAGDGLTHTITANGKTYTATMAPGGVVSLFDGVSELVAIDTDDVDLVAAVDQLNAAIDADAPEEQQGTGEVDATEIPASPVPMIDGETVKDHSKRLLGWLRENLRGKWIEIPSWGQSVELRMRGMKHMTSNAADPVKRELIPSIEKVLQSAVHTGSKENFKKDAKSSAKTYHYLKASVRVLGEVVGVRVVVEEDQQGKLHYDFMVETKTAPEDAVDVAGTGPVNKSGEPTAENSSMDSGDGQAFDDASGSAVRAMVVNLFIDGQAESPSLVNAADLAEDAQEAPGQLASHAPSEEFAKQMQMLGWKFTAQDKAVFDMVVLGEKEQFTLTIDGTRADLKDGRGILVRTVDTGIGYPSSVARSLDLSATDYVKSRNETGYEPSESVLKLVALARRYGWNTTVHQKVDNLESMEIQSPHSNYKHGDEIVILPSGEYDYDDEVFKNPADVFARAFAYEMEDEKHVSEALARAGMYVIDDDEHPDYRTEEFRNALATVQLLAEARGLALVLGDFNNSWSMGLFDSAEKLEVPAYGMCAQITRSGEGVGRLEIERDGSTAIYDGLSGMDALIDPTKNLQQITVGVDVLAGISFEQTKSQLAEVEVERPAQTVSNDPDAKADAELRPLVDKALQLFTDAKETTPKTYEDATSLLGSFREATQAASKYIYDLDWPYAPLTTQENPKSKAWADFTEVMPQMQATFNELQKLAEKLGRAEGKRALKDPSGLSFEEKAKAVYAKHGIFNMPDDRIASFKAAIESKDVAALAPTMSNNFNKASIELFGLATGLKMESTMKRRMIQIDEWAGISPEERANIAAKEKAEAERAKKLKALEWAWRDAESVRVQHRGQVLTLQNYILTLCSENNYKLTIETRKQGVANVYALSNGESNWTIKGREFGRLMRAIIDMGGIKTALKALGVYSEQVGTSNKNDDPYIEFHNHMIDQGWLGFPGGYQLSNKQMDRLTDSQLIKTSWNDDKSILTADITDDGKSVATVAVDFISDDPEETALEMSDRIRTALTAYEKTNKTYLKKVAAAFEEAGWEKFDGQLDLLSKEVQGKTFYVDITEPVGRQKGRIEIHTRDTDGSLVELDTESAYSFRVAEPQLLPVQAGKMIQTFIASEPSSDIRVDDMVFLKTIDGKYKSVNYRGKSRDGKAVVVMNGIQLEVDAADLSKDNPGSAYEQQQDKHWLAVSMALEGMGWVSSPESLKKQFTHIAEGGVVAPDGRRNLYIRRQGLNIQATLGPDVIADIPLVASKIEGAAKGDAETLNAAVEQFAAERRKTYWPELEEGDKAMSDDEKLLRSIIDGKADLLDADLGEKLEAAYGRVSGDSELSVLFSKALDVYQAEMVKEASKALS